MNDIDKTILEEIKENKHMFRNYRKQGFSRTKGGTVEEIIYTTQIENNKLILKASMELDLEDKSVQRLIRKSIKQKTSPIAIKLKEDIKNHCQDYEEGKW